MSTRKLSIRSSLFREYTLQDSSSSMILSLHLLLRISDIKPTVVATEKVSSQHDRYWCPISPVVGTIPDRNRCVQMPVTIQANWAVRVLLSIASPILSSADRISCRYLFIGHRSRSGAGYQKPKGRDPPDHGLRTSATPSVAFGGICWCHSPGVSSADLDKAHLDCRFAPSQQHPFHTNHLDDCPTEPPFQHHDPHVRAVRTSTVRRQLALR